MLGLRQDRVTTLVLPRVFGKRDPARLDRSKSAETRKENAKVTIEEVSRPTDLVVTASQVKAEQCSDEGKVEQRNNSVTELEPSSKYNQRSCVGGYKWESEVSAFE